MAAQLTRIHILRLVGASLIWSEVVGTDNLGNLLRTWSLLYKKILLPGDFLEEIFQLSSRFDGCYLFRVYVVSVSKKEMSSRGSGLIPQTSQRVRNTNSAIIDDLLQKYPDVRYNLAPGATFFGIHPKVRTFIRQLLADEKRCLNLSRYGDVLGLQNLRSRWASVVKTADMESTDIEVAATNENEVAETFPGHELMITAGANQGFMNVILATCDPGDEVLLILPYYFSHLNTLSITGVKAVCVPVEPRTFLLSVNEIEKRITIQSKAVVLVNPGNPSGVELPRTLVEQIHRLCQQKGLWLILDEAYREFCYESCDPTVFTPEPDNHTIKIYTMSKTYGLAGWRVGALLYPKCISEDMRKAQDTIPTHASLISQVVALEALRYNPLSPTGLGLVGQLNSVRQIFLAALVPVYEARNLAHTIVAPNSAFYFFLPYASPDQLEHVSPENDMGAVHFLAETHGVLACPGFSFGIPGHLRISYGTTKPEKAQMAATTFACGLADLLSKAVTDLHEPKQD